MEIEEKMAEKPEDWPANARESMLEAICEKVEEFRKIRHTKPEKCFYH